MTRRVAIEGQEHMHTQRQTVVVWPYASGPKGTSQSCINPFKFKISLSLAGKVQCRLSAMLSVPNLTKVYTCILHNSPLPSYCVSAVHQTPLSFDFMYWLIIDLMLWTTSPPLTPGRGLVKKSFIFFFCCQNLSPSVVLTHITNYNIKFLKLKDRAT